MEKIIEFNLYKYNLQFAQSVKIKNHELTSRAGIIINIKTSSGFSVFGETAPLPFFNSESFEEAAWQLKKIKKNIIGCTIDKKPVRIENTKSVFLNPEAILCGKSKLSDTVNKFNDYFLTGFGFFKDIFSDDGIFPSVKFGIEMALLNIFFLKPDFQKSLMDTEEDDLQVSKLFMDLGTDIKSSMERIIKDGYRTIKIKVGRGLLDYEINKIKEIKKFVKYSVKEDIKLRLDANGLWDLKEAVQFGNQIGSDGIEYIEDPMGDINKYPIFFSETGIPIALDEKLSDFLKLNDINKTGEKYPDYLKAFVLKPGFIGGFSKASDLIAAAKKAGITSVLSNSFESSIAVSAIVLFAYLMDLNNIPVGVDTLKFLKKNLLTEDIEISEGKIKLKEILKNMSKINFDMLELLDC
ncbi:MAG: o-succinylbenzoate synthase [Actinobacteria bacterium]|nr:o-succinylbenzoate synthase [Actinomycetota bacterium]